MSEVCKWLKIDFTSNHWITFQFNLDRCLQHGYESTRTTYEIEFASCRKIQFAHSFPFSNLIIRVSISVQNCLRFLNLFAVPPSREDQNNWKTSSNMRDKWKLRINTISYSHLESSPIFHKIWVKIYLHNFCDGIKLWMCWYSLHTPSEED